MPQYTSFTIQTNTVRSAAESVTACKGKILKLADSVNAVRGGLSGQTEALGMMESVLASLYDHMVYQAEQVNRLGTVAAWCAGRYDNADKNLLGLPQTGLVEPGLAPVRPKEVSISMAQILSSAEREAEARKQKAMQTAVEELNKAQEKKPEAKNEPERRWIENYTDKKPPKTGVGEYSETRKHYAAALVEFTVENGEVKEKVVDHIGEVTEVKETLSIFGTGKRAPESSSIMGEWQKAAEKMGYNAFKSDDPDKDLSNRVWEEKDDGSGKKMKKLDKNEKEQNKYSRDVVSLGIVDWGKSKSHSVLSTGAESKSNYHDVGASCALLSYEGKVGANVGAHVVEKDGKLYKAVGANVEVGGSATVFKADAKAKGKVTIGDDFELIGAGVKGDVKVGHAEAAAGVKGRFMPELGLAGIEVAADASAGAYAAKAKATGSVTALGVEASGSAEVNVGVGITGKVGFTGGKLRCELGASLGVGVKLSFNVDVGGFMKGAKEVLFSKW